MMYVSCNDNSVIKGFEPIFLVISYYFLPIVRRFRERKVCILNGFIPGDSFRVKTYYDDAGGHEIRIGFYCRATISGPFFFRRKSNKYHTFFTP